MRWSDAVDVVPELVPERQVEAVDQVEVGDLAGVASGPRTARASPPGISLLRKKTMRMTPRITMMAWTIRRMQEAVIVASAVTRRPPVDGNAGPRRRLPR